MAAPNEITCKQLLRQIGLPDAPVIVDICIEADFAEDPYLIPGSIRHPHGDVDGLVARLNGRACVVSCQKGLKLSQGLVSLLRAWGIDAQYLQGGMYGWRDTPDAPRLAAAALPPTPRWVTRHRPKIDRIACPWLIRRFVDQEAEFLFIAPDQVLNVADKFAATAFDADGAEFAHVGDKCTFDALLDHFGLRSAALGRVADVVRAADTGALASNAQAAGLLALSVGVSRMYKDDHQQLSAALPLYDALYRWARDGADETHASFARPS